MNYTKFKPELKDHEVDDLERNTEDTKSESTAAVEESKGSGLPKIRIIMIDGKAREMECDFTTTKVRDVIASLFSDELKGGK